MVRWWPFVLCFSTNCSFFVYLVMTGVIEVLNRAEGELHTGMSMCYWMFCTVCHGEVRRIVEGKCGGWPHFWGGRKRYDFHPSNRSEMAWLLTSDIDLYFLRGGA